MAERLLAQDLYRYLLELQAMLRKLGQDRGADRVLHVSKFASGSTTELYGEARLVLPGILADQSSSLPEPARAKLQDVIDGIEREFERIGGA